VHQRAIGHQHTSMSPSNQRDQLARKRHCCSSYAEADGNAEGDRARAFGSPRLNRPLSWPRGRDLRPRTEFALSGTSSAPKSLGRGPAARASATGYSASDLCIQRREARVASPRSSVCGPVRSRRWVAARPPQSATHASRGAPAASAPRARGNRYHHHHHHTDEQRRGTRPKQHPPTERVHG